MRINRSDKYHRTALARTNTIIFICLVITSCSRGQSGTATFKPTQNGFGVLVAPIGVDVGPGAALYYKGTNQKPAMVWPSIGTAGYAILYTNDIALMLADKPNARGEMGASALVVVRGVGPAMDISNDVLKLAAEQNHVDFKRALKVCEPLRLNYQENAMKVLFYSKKYVDANIPDLQAVVTWDQIFGIMEDVKRTGKTNKVTNTEVMYLQKDYEH